MANSKSSGGLNAFVNKHIMPVAAKIGSFKPLIAKYEVKLSEEDLQMIKDCHSKNPSIMKAMNEAKKVED